MTPAIHVVVLGALPPLCKPRSSDRVLQLERWLVVGRTEESATTLRRRRR